jgi:predicted MFS family arabinose efflux permease
MTNHFPNGSKRDPDSLLGLKIGTAAVSRLLLNTARRFAYPFAPALGRHLGVPLTAVTSVIALNQATTLVGLLFGPLADRVGYRLMMILALGLLSLGMFAMGLFPLYGVFLVSLLIAGLGKSMFDPALQAYVGAKIPYHRRGMVIGLVELGWAGSTLIGVPVIGILMDRMGWRSPFFVLGGLGCLCAFLLGILLSNERGGHRSDGAGSGFLKAWLQVARYRPAIGALGFGFCISVGNDNLFVVYGAWLEASFHLSLAALGLGTAMIGLAELLGESLTAALSDRLGLKRSVFVGFLLTVFCYAMLPLFGHALSAALTGLFLIFLTFEFSVVTALSLFTELMPDYRATMMSCFLASAGLGRVLGALIGGPVWLWGGIWATGLVSAGATALSLLVLAWGLRKWPSQI